MLNSAAENAGPTTRLTPDPKDNSAALCKALAGFRAAKDGGTLTLEKGTYPCHGMAVKPPEGGSYQLCVVAEGLENVTLDGGGATIVGQDLAGLFVFRNCRNLTIRNLTVDWEPSPVTTGRVVALLPKEHAFDLAPIFPKKPLPGRIVQGILAYDPARGRLAENGWEVYQTQGERDQDRTQVTPEGNYRVFVKREAPLPEVGWHVVVRHQVYVYNAYFFMDCTNVVMENVTIHSAPGMGVVVYDSRDITLRNVRIVPTAGSWMSVTADATHFKGCRGTVTVEDCEFAGMGDDGLNVHGMYGWVAARVDEHTLAVKQARLHSYYDKKRAIWDAPRTDDLLEFGNGAEPLLPQGQLRVAEAHQEPANERTIIRFADALPASVIEGTLLANLSTSPVLRVRNTEVRANRARGLLLQSRDVLVEGCRFTDVSGAGIQICTDADEWHESLGSRQVTIRNCTFRGCNFGVARRDAALDIFADLAKGKPATAGVHRKLQLLNNTFEDNHGAAISIGSADTVEIRGNHFLNPLPPVVRLRSSRNVTVTDNEGLAPGPALQIEGNCDRDTIHVKP